MTRALLICVLAIKIIVLPSSLTWAQTTRGTLSGGRWFVVVEGGGDTAGDIPGRTAAALTYLIPLNPQVRFDQQNPLASSLLDRALVAAYRAEHYPERRQEIQQVKSDLQLTDEQISAAKILLKKNANGFTTLTLQQYRLLKDVLGFSLQDIFRFDAENAAVMAGQLAAQYNLGDATNDFSAITPRLVNGLTTPRPVDSRLRAILSLLSLLHLPLSTVDASRVEKTLDHLAMTIVNDVPIDIESASIEVRLWLRPYSQTKKIFSLTRLIQELLSANSRLAEPSRRFIQSVAQMLNNVLLASPESGGPALDLLSYFNDYSGVESYWYEHAWEGLAATGYALARPEVLLKGLTTSLNHWLERGQLVRDPDRQVVLIHRYLDYFEKQYGRDIRRQQAASLLAKALLKAKYTEFQIHEKDEVFIQLLAEVDDLDLVRVYKAQMLRSFPSFRPPSAFEKALLERIRNAFHSYPDIGFQLLRVQTPPGERDMVLLAQLADAFEKSSAERIWRWTIKLKLSEAILRIVKSQEHEMYHNGLYMIEYLRLHLSAREFYDAMSVLKNKIESTFDVPADDVVLRVVNRYVASLAIFGENRLLDEVAPCGQLLSLRY